eukprot:TRINITY_DN8924_c0_g1_i1.p1 TRINITY_DN8924_c0_g1~~TRINITY_DN8924_c0_g1_i1.p1  ORF type:complete len:584 (-),score=123.35 TRINITY_DN8924_c0_g1_i1:170-1921(-)
MLRLASFSVTASSQLLLDSASAVLVEGQRVGLVGPNGSGKSTLLRVLSHSDEDIGEGSDSEGASDPYWAITSGKLEGTHSANNREPGSVLIVHQDRLSWSTLFPNLGPDEELRTMSLPDLLDLDLALAVEGGDAERDAEESWRSLSVAAGRELGWDLAGYNDTAVGDLSPGCALRAYLAIALLRPAIQLLLLDEPTNHLDLPSILWLQHSIIMSGKTCVIVSHDEAFLDAVVDHIWEIDTDTGALHTSASLYSSYKHAKLLAIEQQRLAYDQQQSRHAKLAAAAAGLRTAARKGANYQAPDHDTLQRDFKRDRAGRSGKKAGAMDKRISRETKIEKVLEHHALRLRLDPLGPGVDSSIMVDTVQLGFGGGTETPTPLPLRPLSLRIDFGERVALIGYNGVGKSTLLRTLTHSLLPLSGTVTTGRALRIGNLMQEHESLPRHLTPRAHIVSISSDLSPLAAATRIISYGLTLHQVDSPIAELNPGARARLLLATFSIRQVNVLVLDEPTNHLDEEAVREVVASLNTYEGTVIVVSHDREFLEALSLTRTYRLSASGLEEVESVSSFVEEIEEAVKGVVRSSFGR